MIRTDHCQDGQGRSTKCRLQHLLSMERLSASPRRNTDSLKFGRRVILSNKIHKIKTHGSWRFVRLFLSLFYPNWLKGSLQFLKILMHVIKFFRRLLNSYACSAKWFKLICHCSSSCNIWLLKKKTVLTKNCIFFFTRFWYFIRKRTKRLLIWHCVVAEAKKLTL